MRLNKLLNAIPLFTQQENGAMRSLFAAAGLLLLIVCFASEARTQQRSDNSSSTSDLASQNLSRVAASAAEVKAVLTRDAGLMVELKRWVAKDAADHGQIVAESDLSEYAIFDRLSTDI